MQFPESQSEDFDAYRIPNVWLVPGAPSDASQK